MAKSNVTIPNLITVVRLVMVPFAIDALLGGRFDIAFWVFVDRKSTRLNSSH